MAKSNEARPRKRGLSSPEDSPYAYFGSPIPGLISLAEVDQVLDDEAMQALVEAAKIPKSEMALGKRIISRRDYFATAVRRVVREWLETAHEPPVREFGAELIDLQRLLYDALSSGTAAACEEAATAYANLSSAALDAIFDRDRPSVEQIRAGDRAALNWLGGLIPVTATPRLDRHPFASGATYHGSGAAETRKRGRPRDVRREQLLEWLKMEYERATERLPGRGARSPFEHCYSLLLSLLEGRDISEVGGQALRRSVSPRKTMI